MIKIRMFGFTKKEYHERFEIITSQKARHLETVSIRYVTNT